MMPRDDSDGGGLTGDATPRLSVIVAVAENGVIGRDNDLPWRLSADLRRFKKLTMGHAIIMGRATWDSIGRPLPGRTSIVMSRDPELEIEGATVVGSLEAALEVAARKAADPGEVFVLSLIHI